MPADLLIEDTTLVTMNPNRDILNHASLAISGDTIAEIGPAEELHARYPQANRIDGRGKVTLPGMINCHTHVAMSLQKGITLAVPDGLYRVMWPVEKSLTPEDVYIGALAGGAEALKNGATTIVDHYFHVEQTARAVVELGLRGVIGHTIMSRLGPITGEQELETGMRFVQDWQGRNPRVIPWLAPHATDTVDREWLLRLRKFASETGAGLHLHVAQSTRERAYIREQYNLGCLEYLDSLGFLGPDVFAVHCIFIDDSEMDLLTKSGAHMVYCPMAHAVNAHPAHAWDIYQRQADVLLGTDCVCSNNVMDVLGELRIAGVSQKQLTCNPEAMPARLILEMVTVRAAQALGMGDRLGTLAPGYLADVVLVDYDGLHTTPTYSLYDNLVYCCTGRDVSTVLVGGEVVVQDGRLTRVDEREVVEMVDRRGHALIQRATANEADLSYLWEQRF